MGLCQSTALKVSVYNSDGDKKIHTFSMKKMRTFHTMGDVLSLVNVELNPQDKVYARSHVGLEEIPTHTQFQIRDMVVKTQNRVLKYRIVMESFY